MLGRVGLLQLVEQALDLGVPNEWERLSLGARRLQRQGTGNGNSGNGDRADGRAFAALDCIDGPNEAAGFRACVVCDRGGTLRTA